VNTELLKKHFARIGARLKFSVIEPRPFRWREDERRFAVDVGRDRKGEFFEISLRPDADLDISVISLAPRDRHLLLMVKGAGTGEADGGRDIEKFLCGHDERNWFVAAIPEASSASTVREAKEALKPEAVREAQECMRVKPAHRNRRKNAAFVRQGEWFFIPCPDLQVDDRLVLNNEHLVRGGKPHIAQFAFRRGGTTVYVSSSHPQGLTEAQYRDLIRRSPEKRGLKWHVMHRDPEVFVKGRITHPDHKTIRLSCWHRVVPNTESQARSRRNLAFLD